MNNTQLITLSVLTVQKRPKKDKIQTWMPLD